jgi:hypothetical protein
MQTLLPMLYLQRAHPHLPILVDTRFTNGQVLVQLHSEADMAHFAQIDENNVVLQVIVVNNSDCLDESGGESEAVGVAFCQSLLGGNWRQTSYNGNMRKNYAGIGFQYDSTRDAFIPPQQYASWLLDEQTCLWNAPTPMPTDDKQYRWDEPTTSWIEVQS